MDQDTPPTKVPGHALARQRDAYGVTQQALAKQLRVHRNTVRDWEHSPELDVIRQRRYLKALRELVEGAA